MWVWEIVVFSSVRTAAFDNPKVLRAHAAALDEERWLVVFENDDEWWSSQKFTKIEGQPTASSLIDGD